MKSSITIGVAVAMSIASVTARTTNISARGVDPQFSPFTKCIQVHHPGFPKDGSKPTSKEMRDCVNQARIHTRSADMDADDETLIYEPEPMDAIKPRNIIDTVQVLGKKLYLEHKPLCDGNKVHDNFVWVEDIRKQTSEVCKQLSSQITAYGLHEDGGVGTVVNLLTNGHDKQGHQLKDKRHVTATFLLNFIPPAKMATEEIKQLAGAVYDLCNDGLDRIATKGDGCSASIKYFRPSKAKTYHSDGAIGGILKIFLDSDETTVAQVALDFSNDG